MKPYRFSAISRSGVLSIRTASAFGLRSYGLRFRSLRFKDVVTILVVAEAALLCGALNETSERP